MINQLLDIIHDSQPVEQSQAALSGLLPQIKSLGQRDVDSFFEQLVANIERKTGLHREATEADTVAPDISDSQQVILQSVIHELVLRERAVAEKTPWSDSLRANVEKLYLATAPENDLRNHILRWLATDADQPRLQMWTDLICNTPPEHRLGIILAFSPLMQSDFDPPEWMLNELLEKATTHSQIASPVFDLFNFYFRHQKVTTHTAAGRIDSLSELLGQLVEQMRKIESGKLGPDANVMKLNQQVSDSVSLIVALCDAFALLEHKPAIPHLSNALSLRHRRVQTEAAAALARMGIEDGKRALVELAQQPVARIRALAYAEELGFKDKVSLELQGEIAIAESHLAIWLSEPEQMGLAPSDIEMVDNREMYWPSYEHPVQCYLFQYSYGAGEQAHSNLGICGPLTHAFAADLRGLNHEDVYAAFAGWQTVHQEIFQTDLDRARKIAPTEIAKLESTMQEAAGDNEFHIQTVGNFFGQWVLIAAGIRDSQHVTLIVDTKKTYWIPAGNPAAPIDWQLAYSIWKGHELLSNFNPETTNSAE
jgi:hypothetical protein